MTINFFENKNLLKTKNAKSGVPLRGDLVSFLRNVYYVVVSVEWHYENDIVLIRLDRIGVTQSEKK